VEAAPTHQHYVPQFVLRNFASGRNKQIYVFDKATGKSFKTAVRNIASVSGFYDFEINGVFHSLDPFFQNLENRANEVFKKILRGRSIRNLDVDEKAAVAVFSTVQMLRTIAQRKQYKDANDKLREEIELRGGDPRNVKGFEVLDEEQARIEQIMLLPKLAQDFAPHFVHKAWLLYSTPQQRAFYISDNPVTMHNTVNQDPDRGTLGLAVPGIEIYFPLSATLCLGFLCPSLEQWIREGQARADRLGAPVSIHEFIRALDGEATLGLAPESVTHHNSLQVINAERYVFSCDGDFALVREMLQSNPELADGPRHRVA
jgi:Protein of unknown function (DUF4238)